MEKQLRSCGRGAKCINPLGPLLPATNEYFSRDKGNSDGLHFYCKVCQRALKKEYDDKNRDQSRKKSLEYYRNNRERYRDNSRRYRIRKYQLGGKFTHKQLDELYKSQKGLCKYCGVFVGLAFDLDHIVPLSKGGTSAIENMAITCGKCNRSKRNNTSARMVPEPDKD